MARKSNESVFPAIQDARTKKRIVESSNFPFYRKYHDGSYVKFHDSRSRISLTDKKSASHYILQNDRGKELVCYRIDEGLIVGRDSGKCDFGIYTEDDCLILIELKGVDYERAIEQLLMTIDILLKTPEVEVSRLFTRVVLSKTRVPNILMTKEKKLAMMVENKYHGNHAKCSRQMEEILSKI